MTTNRSKKYQPINTPGLLFMDLWKNDAFMEDMKNNYRVMTWKQIHPTYSNSLGKKDLQRYMIMISHILAAVAFLDENVRFPGIGLITLGIQGEPAQILTRNGIADTISALQKRTFYKSIIDEVTGKCRFERFVNEIAILNYRPAMEPGSTRQLDAPNKVRNPEKKEESLRNLVAELLSIKSAEVSWINIKPEEIWKDADFGEFLRVWKDGRTNHEFEDLLLKKIDLTDCLINPKLLDDTFLHAAYLIATKYRDLIIAQ